MSEGNEMESTSPVDINVVDSTNPPINNVRRMSKDDTFVSASDLSNFMDTADVPGNNSNHSEPASNSSSLNTSSTSGSSYSESSSSPSIQSSLANNGLSSGLQQLSRNQDSLSDKTNKLEEESGIPVFATCSSTSVAASTSGSVRRSESLSALRSASIDIIIHGSELDNNDEKDSSSFNDNSKLDFQQGDTYYTPSTSLHNINITKNAEKTVEKSFKKHSQVEKSLGIESKAVPDDLSEHHHKEDTSPSPIPDLILETPKVIVSNQENLNLHSPHVLSEDENEVLGYARDEDSLGIVISDLTLSIDSNASKEGAQGSEVEKPITKQNFRGKPTKKRMWYQQIFSTSYKSRSGDFKKLFKDLPVRERLLVDYSCALQKEILVQGRMYVSQGYVSFHANIFGWETQTSIRLKEITSITKEKTALVIPNAIQIMSELGDKYFFTSFVTRDATYLMLFKLWQSALLEDAMPSREIQKLVLSCYGEELIITSEDETESIRGCLTPLELIEDSTDIPPLVSAYHLEDHDATSTIDKLEVCATDIGPAIAVSGNLGSSIITSKGRDGLEKEYINDLPANIPEHSDITDSSDSDDEYQPPQGLGLIDETDSFEIPECPVKHSEGKITLNAVIACNVDQLFTMLFTNSKFYLDLHTARKTFDVNQSPWEIGADGTQKTRQISFTVTLSQVMGPKHSQVTETQVMIPVSKPGVFYAIDSESVNAGIPYADTFYVTVHYCLTRISANESQLVIVNQVKYKKSVWGITKSIIEKNCWAGIEEFYAHLERALKEECSKMSLGTSPVPSPKIVAGSIQRRRPPRKKNKAPDVPPSIITPLVSRSVMRNGSIPGSNISIPPTAVTSEALQTSSEGTLVVKVILSVLVGLLVLNAFLYFKLTRLETTTSSSVFSSHSFVIPEDMPQNHEEWLLLLQKQEALHRIELQKWHEILMSALKILHQAESDLETLKFHISSYNGAKYPVRTSKQEWMISKSSLSNPDEKTSSSANSTENLSSSGDKSPISSSS